MTLVLSVGNAHQIVMVADRMLSRARTPVDPDANKLALLQCRESRWAVGFSGLATLASAGGRTYFRTHQFIAEALADAAEPDHSGISVIDRFAERLMDRFDQSDAVSSGISVLFMGYQEIGQGVSDLTRRLLGARMAKPVECQANGAIASAVGETRAMDPALLQELANKAAVGAPAAGLRDFAAHIVRRASESKVGRGVVGQKCSSICVPINPSVGASLDYLTDQPISTRRYGNVIDCRKDGPGKVMTDYSFTTFGSGVDDVLHQTVQKVGRNDPCPCGSGKKYKRCHYLIGPQAPERYEMLVRFQYRPGMTLTLPLPRKGGSEIERPSH